MSDQEDLSDLIKFIRFCNSAFGKRVMRKEADFVNEYLSDCKKILDVGCGIGVFEQLLPELDITGLDRIELFLREARRRSNKEFIHGNAESLPFRDNSFDGVFSVATIEFLDDYEKAIMEIDRVLKPEGKILIMILNHDSEYFKEHNRKKDSYFRRMKHRNLRDMRQYCLRFFNLLRVRYFLGIKGEQIINTEDYRIAALYVIMGQKR